MYNFARFTCSTHEPFFIVKKILESTQQTNNLFYVGKVRPSKIFQIYMSERPVRTHSLLDSNFTIMEKALIPYLTSFKKTNEILSSFLQYRHIFQYVYGTLWEIVCFQR